MIIGIHGPARSGKNTVAAILREALRDNGIRTEEIAFAEPLKRVCTDVFDFSEEQVYGNKKDDADPRYRRMDGKLLTPRHAMQQLGTEWGRGCCPDIWLKYLHKNARRLEASDKIVIVPDVRFPNEALFIQERGMGPWGPGGFLFYLDRRHPDAKVEPHSSENGIPKEMAQAILETPWTDDGLDRLGAEVLTFLPRIIEIYNLKGLPHGYPFVCSPDVHPPQQRRTPDVGRALPSRIAPLPYGDGPAHHQQGPPPPVHGLQAPQDRQHLSAEPGVLRLEAVYPRCPASRSQARSRSELIAKVSSGEEFFRYCGIRAGCLPPTTRSPLAGKSKPGCSPSGSFGQRTNSNCRSTSYVTCFTADPSLPRPWRRSWRR